MSEKVLTTQKYLPSDLCRIMNEEGYSNFKMHHHTKLWQQEDAKKPAKGYGVHVAKTWYWYESWLNSVREHCANNREQYV